MKVYQPRDEDMLYLVLDRLEGGSVDALRKQKGHVEEGLAAFIMAQVVDAVRHCHNKNIAVRGEGSGNPSERRWGLTEAAGEGRGVGMGASRMKAARVFPPFSLWLFVISCPSLKVKLCHTSCAMCAML